MEQAIKIIFLLTKIQCDSRRPISRLTGKQCFQEKNTHKFTLPEFETFKMEFKFTFPTNFWHCIILYSSFLLLLLLLQHTHSCLCVYGCVYAHAGMCKTEFTNTLVETTGLSIYLSTPKPLHNSFNMLLNSE